MRSLLCAAALGSALFSPAASAGVQAAAGRYAPVADPAAQVIVGHARFTVLTPQLVRMEWSADGRFEDRASFVFLNRRLPVPAFQKTIARRGGAQVLHLRTAALDLTYHPEGLAKGGDGRFTAASLSVTFTLNGQPVTWHPGMQDPENLLGTTRTLDGVLGGKTKDPIEQGLISRSGWALVDDSTRPLFNSADFSFPQGEQSPLPWVVERPEITSEAEYARLKDAESPARPVEQMPATQGREAAGQEVQRIARQDWYFFGYGHDYKQALGDYTRVSGPIPLPPRFAFGAWWSRFWSYSDQELESLVQQAHEADVPLDVLVVDMDWHLPFGNDWTVIDPSGNQARWTGYTWNKLLFPDPKLFLDRMHDKGLKVTLNLHPASGVQPFEEPYPAMARAMGVDPASGKYIPFNITDKTFARNYLDILHHPLEKQGIDFWWLDWQQSTKTALPGVNPTWWLNYVHFTDQQREGKRPLLFHRWGGMGNHRYQIGFSGDVVSSWDSLAFQPWFTATAANVGYAYWSHDIGGHMPGKIEPELYTRWLQFGALSPILRTHTTKNAEAERRVWAYPEPYSSIMRESYHLRYALLPYLYTEARRTSETGVAFFRPLYYDWPEQAQAYANREEYQLGENLVVAPVVAPADPETGLTKEQVWLPPGDWMEWPTGRHLHGPAQVERAFSLAQTPVYVKQGAILPMAPPMRSTGEKPLSPLVVSVFPLQTGQQSAYTLYEDDGASNDYAAGPAGTSAAQTQLRAAQAGDVLTVSIDAVRGSFAGMPAARSYQLRLPADWPPSQVLVNGNELPYRAGASAEGLQPGWQFEGNTLTTIIDAPSFSTGTRVTFEVRRDPALMSRRAELDGFAGTITRLREAYDALQNNTPVDTPPDELTDAMQAGDRLLYHPEQAGEIVAHWREVLPKVAPAVARAENVKEERRKEVVHSFMWNNYTPEAATLMLSQIRHRDRVASSAIGDLVPQNTNPVP